MCKTILCNVLSHTSLPSSLLPSLPFSCYPPPTPFLSLSALCCIGVQSYICMHCRGQSGRVELQALWLLLLFLHKANRLVGLVVRRPPRERKIAGSNPACTGIFSGSSHISDLKIGTPVATLPGTWRYRVSAGTGRPGVSIL